MTNSDSSNSKTGIFERLGCQIHYWLTGPADAPLVAFTHGVAMDHTMFAAQVDALCRRYRVLTWDVRGHNESQPIGDGFSVALVADDLAALLDHLDYRQAILVGHSMGGLVSQELLFNNPKRVTALITIGSPCLTLPTPFFFKMLMKMSPGSINVLPYSFFKWAASHHITTTHETKAYVDTVLGRFSKQQFVAMWRAVVNSIHPKPGYRITQPLLITYGRRDNLGLGFIKQQVHAWARRDTNGNSTAIPNGAHNAHQENPAFFNRILLDFLQQVTGE